MLDLFGVPVPDDVVAAFLAAAASKKAVGAKKAYRPEDPFGEKEAPDVGAKAERSADVAKKFFDAYMAQGFTRAEALKLTIGNVNTKI